MFDQNSRESFQTRNCPRKNLKIIATTKIFKIKNGKNEKNKTCQDPKSHDRANQSPILRREIFANFAANFFRKLTNQIFPREKSLCAEIIFNLFKIAFCGISRNLNSGVSSFLASLISSKGFALSSAPDFLPSARKRNESCCCHFST